VEFTDRSDRLIMKPTWDEHDLAVAQEIQDHFEEFWAQDRISWEV
jgi:hypothetical protein